VSNVRLICLGLLGVAVAAARLPGQALPPAGTGGTAALANALEQLGANKRVLLIAAHPDDEDTQLLAWLSRGMGAQVAYLSLTRGDGGQNLIGPELGADLGILRSAELLAARSLDGARQYFTRAYDFGFSKSAAETFRYWPHDTLFQDVLAVVRRFRPQIIVSTWSGTPRDGHGQHQAAGVLAREVYEALRDSSWGPVKFYRSDYFDSAAATLRIPTGTLDPVLGKSYYQIAMAGRSQHRSQDMGRVQRPGPAQARLTLADSKVGHDGGIFAGVDTTWSGQQRYSALIDSARRALNPFHPSTIVPYLARALGALAPGLDRQREVLEGALADAAGAVVDATVDDGIVTPGERLQVDVSVWNAGEDSLRVEGVDLAAPPGWTVERVEPWTGSIAPNTLRVQRFAVTVAPDAPRSQPYFLRHPLAGALYDWTDVPADVRGLPFAPPPLVARIRCRIGGTPVALTREVAYLYGDQANGEVRRPLFVTEDFDVAVTPGLIVWPMDGSAGTARTVTVTMTSRIRGQATGTLRLSMPAGWAPVQPDSLSFAHEDESKSATFTLRPPPNPTTGTFTLRATVAESNGRVSDGALSLIDYPHIRPRPSVHPSTVEIRVARILLPGLTRVGYVRGAADRVPEALKEVGVPIVLLDADSLARGDLSRYDAIVIGSRAYEVDTALVVNNGRLLDYARDGGLLIVQYQQYPFIQGGYAPYLLTIARPHDRVTDETAHVTLLEPASPVFHTPNEIGEDDWRDWVQERGLYFAHQWDSTYVPLLEMHDPGSPPLDGGLLVSPLGRGTYVYTGLSFFRQLPAGVVGAYRLFSNLLGLKSRHVP
jgi:LmbE family N-acetylglucosaminyl deacetylase